MSSVDHDDEVKDVSPTPTMHAQARIESHPSATVSESASTEVADTNGSGGDEKKGYADTVYDEKADLKGKGPGFKDDRFEDRGIHELDDEGQTKRVRLVMEQRTGKELIAGIEDDGQYTTPRWWVDFAPMTKADSSAGGILCRLSTPNSPRLQLRFRSTIPKSRPKYPPRSSLSCFSIGSHP